MQAGAWEGAHLLDVDLRVLLTTHEHVLDARDRRARRGEARGRSKVRRDGGDLGNLGLLREGRGGGAETGRLVMGGVGRTQVAEALSPGPPC